MGNDMVQQAVEAASDEMGNVQAAADAISAAIAKVTPWLNGQTWTGSAATSWEGDWNSFYASVKSCLNDLPAAEASIVSSTRTQMEALVAKQHQAA
ncbi:MAG TPA: hypothetical protein VGG54_18105 [Trebonia sp.]